MATTSTYIANIYVVGGSTTIRVGGTQFGNFPNAFEYKRFTLAFESRIDFTHIRLHFGGAIISLLFDDITLSENTVDGNDGLPACIDKTPAPAPLSDPVPGICYKNHIQNPSFEAGGSAWTAVSYGGPAGSPQQDTSESGGRFKAHSGSGLL